IGDLAMARASCGQRLALRHEFVEGAASARGQFEYALVGVAAPTERLARAPIVRDFVIVPLREQRHLGIEGEHILVEKVVFVIAAEVGERLGDLRFLLSDDVPPYLAVRKLGSARSGQSA